MSETDREYRNAETAIVLAGGKSTRMQPIEINESHPEHISKTLVEIGGKTLLFWVLRWLKNQGVKNVIVGMAWQKEKVRQYINDSYDIRSLSMRIKAIECNEEDDTGGAFRTAIEAIETEDEDVVATYGDELIKFNLQEVWDFHLKRQPTATIVVTPMVSQYGHVDLDQDGIGIIDFREKPLLATTLVSTGVFIFNRDKIMPFLPAGTEKLETTTFPELARERQLAAYRLQVNDDWATVDTPKDISHAEKKLKSWRWIR